ncbi:MAG: tetratricopeptide repeat protein [Acidobacteria bacterium]|nr:tetratricopeptide repeat protein [Acidobacteriota bacterium]MCI0623755.1 tetratricopeptide repeat protein [Acidobacteriota bacterium]MCI0721106.1 tetratricopeptide repeat protein [Acidobacteriota bacterium]
MELLPAISMQEQARRNFEIQCDGREGETTMTQFAVVFALFMAMPFEAMAAKVKAKFVDHDKKPILKAESKLVEKNSGKEYFGKSNKKGEAEFEKVEPGEYQLYAQSQGYMPNKSDWLTVPEKEASFTLMLVGEEYYRKSEQDGNTALTQGKFAEAAGHYEKLLELMPKEAVIWSNLAKAYVGVQQPQKAREAAQKAATLDAKQYGDLEKQLNALLSLEEGRQALEGRDFAKAVSALTQALSVDPSNADAFYALALAYGHQKKYPEALKNIDEALKLRPNEAGFLEVKRILTHNAAIK